MLPLDVFCERYFFISTSVSRPFKRGSCLGCIFSSAIQVFHSSFQSILTTLLSRKFTYDSLKIEHQAGGAKTSDPVISKERDETLVLIKPADADAGTVFKTIGELGVRDETEVSLFSWKDYVEYCEGDAHGQTQW